MLCVHACTSAPCPCVCAMWYVYVHVCNCGMCACAKACVWRSKDTLEFSPFSFCVGSGDTVQVAIPT